MKRLTEISCWTAIGLALMLITATPRAVAAPPAITNLVLVPSLTIESDLGVTNQILFSTALATNEWSVLTNLLVTGSPYRFFDLSAPHAPQRFYRVVQTSTNTPPGAAVSFAVVNFPKLQTAGVTGGFTVMAQDASGKVVTGYRGTIRFSSTDLSATLPGDYTFTAGDAGVKAFTATLRTAGTRAITATDTAVPTLTGTQNGIVVTPAAAASFVVAGLPSPRTAGAAGNFTVTARDAFGNTASGYLGTVSFTSTDPAATLPANTAFTAADSGVKAFAATLKTAGTRAITATDTVTATLTGTQSAIQVTPAVPVTLAVVGFPSSPKTGVPGTFTVVLKDAFGNIATGYKGTLAFSSSDPAATLPINTTFTQADAGVRTFSATLRTLGIQFITARDAATPTITGTQAGIVVLP